MLDVVWLSLFTCSITFIGSLLSGNKFLYWLSLIGILFNSLAILFK